MHEKRAVDGVKAHRAEILDAGAQQGLEGESGPERVRLWRTEGNLSDVSQVFLKIVRDDGEKRGSRG